MQNNQAENGQMIMKLITAMHVNQVNTFSQLPLTIFNCSFKLKWNSQNHISRFWYFSVLVFSITNRKHHCRNCGQIFCADCSGKQATMPNYKKPQRVCEPCFGELQQGKWHETPYQGNASRSNTSFYNNTNEDSNQSKTNNSSRSSRRSSLWDEQVH